jgi:hypothetical protein
MMPKLLPLLGTAAMLCACEARIGNDAPPVADNATAAGKAEEGKVTIEAPGFNMSIDIPEGVRAHSGMDSDNGLLYPGANFSGVHVVGRPEGPNGDSEGEVELRFNTGDATDRVVAWYRIRPAMPISPFSRSAAKATASPLPVPARATTSISLLA